MSVRVHHLLGLALILLATGLIGLRAEEPPRSRPTPIIFSAPRSDTVSSNLNQISTKTSPLTDLESGLKKPFEIFDTGGQSGRLRPVVKDMNYVPPAPVLKSKKLKDLLEKQAEDNYLLPDDDASALSNDELWKSDDNPLDPSGKRLKSPLDRYYDRIDRMRAGQTNQASARNLDLLGDKSDSDEKDDRKSRLSGGLFDGELSASAQALRQMSNNIPEGGRLSSESYKPRSFGDLFGLGPVEANPTTRTKDTRLDDFKRLLDGPGYGSRNDFNVAPPSSAATSYQPPSPAVGVPSSILSVTPPPVGSGSAANPSGFAGLPGTPTGLPDYALSAPSLTPTPPVQQAPPRPPTMPTFNVPRRRF